MLRLVNLVGRTLPHDTLELKGLKVSFTLNCALKRGNDLKTVSRFDFNLLQKFEVAPLG